MATALETYVASVVANVESSWPRYSQFARTQVATHPIPFFGDIESARVLTLGVNPSAEEFVGRNWPSTLGAADLSQRLVAYFRHATPPHPWFATWNDALASLGASFSSGAAHLDLSPRATAAMGSTKDWRAFAEMIEFDSASFFGVLPFCIGARALLMSGCVTKRWYISDFVARIAPQHGYRLIGSSDRSGAGRVGFFKLEGHGRTLPVFFCSVSPSARTGNILVQRVLQHQAQIMSWISH